MMKAEHERLELVGEEGGFGVGAEIARPNGERRAALEQTQKAALVADQMLAQTARSVVQFRGRRNDQAAAGPDVVADPGEPAFEKSTNANDARSLAERRSNHASTEAYGGRVQDLDL